MNLSCEGKFMDRVRKDVIYQNLSSYLLTLNCNSQTELSIESYKEGLVLVSEYPLTCFGGFHGLSSACVVSKMVSENDCRACSETSLKSNTATVCYCSFTNCQALS